MNNWVKFIGRILAGLLCCLTAATTAVSSPAAPPTEEAGVATLYRDLWGVPHIYAKREEDGFYALGFAQAEDQLLGILSAALAVEGRAAAVFGEGDLPWNIPMALVEPGSLIWRHAEEAKAAYARLGPAMRRNQEAYVAGFNAYLAEHPERVPDWAPRLEPWHLIGIPRTILWFFIIGDGLRDCAKGGVSLSANTDSDAARSVTSSFASNEWAVAPQRTADGSTILLSDPHSIINGSLFYEFRMKAGELDVLGYTLGTAMMLTHNRDVAWGMTTGGPDVSDCYALTLDPKRPERYRIHGQWRTFETHQWTHQVKDKPTVHGSTDYALINGFPSPVVARKDGKAYAIVTPYFNDAGGLHEQLDAMVRAHSVAEVRKASERNGMFPQNVMVADRAGSIFYLRDGRVPRRDPSIDWTTPVSGDDPRTVWHGIHPSRDLVQVLDPPNGYLQNDNTPPDNMVVGSPVVKPSDYPAYIYNDVAALRFMSRAERTNSVLDASPRLTVAQAKRLAQDELWIGTEHWTRWLDDAARSHPELVESLSPPAQRVFGRLDRFDGVANVASVAALNHFFWRSAVWSTLDKNGQQLLIDVLAGHAQPTDALQKLAIESVERAVQQLQQALGSVDRPYGDYFRVSRDGQQSWSVGGGPPLSVQDYFQCGVLEKPPYVCSLTQRAMSFRARLKDGRPRLTEGSRALRLVVFGEPLRTYSLHNYGQSDNPESPHYTDQARLLTSTGQMKEVPFTLEELLPSVEQVTVLRRRQ